jgi:hypothetical protein
MFLDIFTTQLFYDLNCYDIKEDFLQHSSTLLFQFWYSAESDIPKNQKTEVRNMAFQFEKPSESCKITKIEFIEILLGIHGLQSDDEMFDRYVPL